MTSSFGQFAGLCDRLAATTKKLEKRALIADWLRALPVEDARRGALYLAGQTFAETDGRVLNLGGSVLGKALAQLSGATKPVLHAAYLRHGDLGAVAEELLAALATNAAVLTLALVEEQFAAISVARGPAAKLVLVAGLLGMASPVEAKYLIKLALGDMRTGVKQSLVEEAIAFAFGVDAAAVRRATMLKGSLPEVVRLAVEGKLGQARMALFHPLGFMLASPVDSVDAALARFAIEAAELSRIGGEEIHEDVAIAEPTSQERDLGHPAAEKVEPQGLKASLPPNFDGTAEAVPLQDAELPVVAEAVLREAQIEDKYDGIRAQLHCGDPEQPGRVALFSRSKEEMTAAFPELAEAFAGLRVPMILDGEVLAWDFAAGQALPFSALQKRIGRKRVTEEMREETPVVFMAFDLLYRGEDLLLEMPLSERRAALEGFVTQHGGTVRAGFREASGFVRQGSLFAEEAVEGHSRLVIAPATSLESAEQLDQAYMDARVRGNEGVMLKARGSLYQPGRRGLAWLKLKRELATLDVVVTAAEFGHGRRAGILSDYTFAVRDGEALKNVGKAYSGLTDVEIAELSQFFMDHTLEDYGSVRSVEPLLVLEVAFNNVMRSERHASGFALRFPRILRIRRDKLVEEVDTLARVEEIYGSQPELSSRE